MALVGTIKDFGLADILQLIGLQRKSGLLTLEHGTDRVTVKFLEGAVVGADTSTRNLEELLGSVLVRTGRITEAQLQDTLQIQASTLRFILVGIALMLLVIFRPQGILGDKKELTFVK